MSAAGALGAFLTTLGKGKEDKRKEDLMIKLEKEKEDTAEQRAIAREDRASARSLKEVKNTKLEFGEDGKAFNVYYNSNGDVLKKDPASQADVDSFNMGRQKEKLGLTSLETDIAYKGALTDETRGRAADAPLDRQLKRQNLESMIQARADANDIRRSQGKGRRGSDGQPVDDSIGTMVNEMIKDSADLQKQYTESSSNPMTADEFRMVAQQSIQEAARGGKDADVVFAQALRNFNKIRADRKAKGK